MPALTTSNSSEKIVIARKVHFSSAHFYNQEKFSHEENLRVFGRCYTPYGHGHNYVLEAFIEGPIDPATRLVMNLFDLDRILKNVVDHLDHQHLNFDVAYFKSTIPTTENISFYLWGITKAALSKEFPNLSLNRIRLFETDDLWVEMRG